MSFIALPQLLEASARRRPDHVAVEDPPAGSITYRELDALSDRVRDRLRALGVRPGDRVGIYLRKSIDAVAAIFGALKAGAAYVPVDPAAPAWRCAYILDDCKVAALVVEDRLAEGYLEEARKLGAAPRLLVLDGAGGGAPMRAALDREDAREPAQAAPSESPSPDDVAYILYTSGSTGKPKGVVLTHRAAVGFVDWCSEVFAPRDDDRFSSHAPFHFDLSILDIYLPLKHGATLVLVGAELGKDPQALAAHIAERGITHWYSTPSILSMLAQYGKMQRHDYSALRAVLYAGEVFPVKHLRHLTTILPRARYYNLYGPTETNVCTWYETPAQVPEERVEPYPIGRVCAHLRARVVDEQGRDVPRGGEGELVIAGANVMREYWNLPERTAAAFLVDERGERWYRTGDLVTEGEDGVFTYVGRRDRMVKRRGYRIELGEIEAGLYRHPAVKEAAVVATRDADAGVRIKAFLSCREGASPSVVELKRFCAEALPAYMVPDAFGIEPALPKTSTDKVDYQRLAEMA
jgi:amino acid adenylation domain-containing protein